MGLSDQIIYECCEEDENGVKTNNRNQALVRLLGMMGKRFWIYLIAIIVMSVSMSGFTTITAMLLKEVISMAQSGDNSHIFILVMQNVIAGVLVLLLYQVGFIAYTLEAKKGGANLQRKVLSKSMKLPYRYYENTHSGDFMSKLMYDCGRSQDVYGSRFRRILMPAFMVIFYLTVMFMLSWQVTLCLFGACIATFIINTLFISPMKNISRELSDTQISLTERLTNILSGMELLKIFSLDDKMVDKYTDDNERFRKGQKKLGVLSAGLDSLNHCFDLASSLVFIAVGIFFVSIGVTTIDKLAAIYVIYGSMSWNFLQIGIYIPSMASCLANAQRIFEFLDMTEEPERYINTGKAVGDGYIEFEGVDFSYDGEEKVLDNFSLHIEKGKTIALKGESGRGKSTIAKILLGFYPVQKGNISIAGKAFSDMTLEEIRGMIGYVPQEPYLYDVSIAENISYGKPGASMEEIVAAAKAANAHDFILRQEHGYETNAGERGNKLSGGEKQRIAIARAILKNAPILILDEATSALDNQSERLVNEALNRLCKNRTTIMIAHRASTIAMADSIIQI